jgi:hypothetical protein
LLASPKKVGTGQTAAFQSFEGRTIPAAEGVAEGVTATHNFIARPSDDGLCGSAEQFRSTTCPLDDPLPVVDHAGRFTRLNGYPGFRLH